MAGAGREVLSVAAQDDDTPRRIRCELVAGLRGPMQQFLVQEVVRRTSDLGNRYAAFCGEDGRV